jgi:ATP-dependent DNA helicase MPH1
MGKWRRLHRYLCLRESRAPSTRGLAVSRTVSNADSANTATVCLSRDFTSRNASSAALQYLTMSSDGFIDDISLDAAAFEQLDAIEAAHFSLPRPDVSEGKDLGKFEDADEGQPISVAGPSNYYQKNHSGRTVQTTLFGSIPPTSSKNKNAAPIQKQSQRSQSNPRNPFGQQAKRSKIWDHTEFAKTGWKRSKSKTTTQQTLDDNDEGEEEEPVEFEQFPAPVVSGLSLLPVY